MKKFNVEINVFCENGNVKKFTESDPKKVEQIAKRIRRYKKNVDFIRENLQVNDLYCEKDIEKAEEILNGEVK